jgi:C-terminal processing protease CtpA/Prc
MRCLFLILMICALLFHNAETVADEVDARAGRSAAPALIPAADLEKDADVLYDALKSLHPGIYRYSTPAQFDQRFQDLKQELARGATLSQAFLLFTRFAVAIRCGHTWTNPLNQPPPVAHALLEQHDRLPVHFTVVGRRFLATQALPATGVHRGDEIVAIDGVETDRVIQKLWPYLRADGSSDGKRLAQIGHDAGESAFDLYYPLIEPPLRQTRTLILRAFGTQKPRTVTVALTTEAEREKLLGSGTNDEPDAWTFRTDRNIATITMPSWAFWNSHFDWKDWLDKTFADLNVRKTPFLVIDLRRNEGGDGAIGLWLEERLATTPREYAGHLPVLVYDIVPARLRPYLSTWSKEFYDQRPRIEPLGEGTYTLKDHEPEVARILPSASPYVGKVFVLTGPNNSSATFEFARIVKEAKLATLIGQPTGGNLRGITGGNMFFLTLPSSGITIDVPVIAWKARSETPDSPVTPDVVVAPDLVALAHGRDPEMDRVANNIRALQKTRQTNH